MIYIHHSQPGTKKRGWVIANYCFFKPKLVGFFFGGGNPARPAPALVTRNGNIQMISTKFKTAAANAIPAHRFHIKNKNSLKINGWNIS